MSSKCDKKRRETIARKLTRTNRRARSLEGVSMHLKTNRIVMDEPTGFMYLQKLDLYRLRQLYVLQYRLFTASWNASLILAHSVRRRPTFSSSLSCTEYGAGGALARRSIWCGSGSCHAGKAGVGREMNDIVLFDVSVHMSVS
jgi:hypothetical protein